MAALTSPVRAVWPQVGLAALWACAPLVFIACAVAVATDATHAVDRTVLDLAVSARGPVLDALAELFAKGLGGIGVTVLTLVAMGLLWRLAARRAALLLGASMALGGLVLTLSKLAFGRARPLLHPWLDDPHGLSFPSGHATLNALFWPLLALILSRLTTPAGARRLSARAARLTWALALAIPLVTAWSRVHAAVHWPSDVVAGLALGACFVLLAGRFHGSPERP